MTSNASLTQEYLDIIAQRDGDLDGRRAAYAYMKDSTAIVHHRVVDCTYVPRLFDRATYDIMKSTAETAHRILCKVMQRYLDDPAYRRVFDFDPRLEELILLPRGYDALLPFARVDTFLNEDTGEIMFCEFNGDGSSGMNENREITNSVAASPAFRAFAAHHEVQGCNLFDPWVDEFIAIYGTYKHRVDNPRFAVCDYLENGVVDEFKMFAALFEKRGYACTVADVRDLSFDGERLRTPDGQPVDAIWRRCVTNDVIDHWDASQDLIDAVRAEKVALIGSFAGHIVHDKQIFEVLFKPETRAFLTDEEIAFVERTVPLTTFLDETAVDLDAVRRRRTAGSSSRPTTTAPTTSTPAARSNRSSGSGSSTISRTGRRATPSSCSATSRRSRRSRCRPTRASSTHPTTTCAASPCRTTTSTASTSITVASKVCSAASGRCPPSRRRIRA